MEIVEKFWKWTFLPIEDYGSKNDFVSTRNFTYYMPGVLRVRNNARLCRSFIVLVVP